MEHFSKITCKHCGNSQIKKNGVASSGMQVYFCRPCKKNFQHEYKYKANEKGIGEKISELTLNGSGTRDIGRVLGISKDTVTRALKKKPGRGEPIPLG